ncbi:Alpha-1,3-mannosyltransferase CMT1 OS=Cryptococcus neoformans var, neoformans serotype D (strain JEC21 / ATCC MYA-565) GN=CMT1 PE=1 SV=1 [Rhizoctonia solani AG-1 IB]|uniref:Alpha-1,3-mannosyltransferase n=1 Tax=Thanatephorus cucumeris (strain AG1-IB / isolate 7/3/14) TaxID=1108050 RepID=M5BR70_THACB|nr:alpha-1,3-mannosyltransferase [Rhizoctonia solani AG-1 IB]CEL53038.1 Alpha-1,3-mannosyltransferase CMT1 OS=Cryptococcus neoformans var, neoformans serotype D (strain JEC21 / ATCC MYA-565) GN=CMT1 PE=1 SV=1 [Rhizoctonia solani AG-1 IB]
MLPLPAYAHSTLKRRWRISYLHLLSATALLGLSAYALLLFSSRTPTYLQKEVQRLRSIPNDFSQVSSRKGGTIDEDALVETLAIVDNLRVEFNRQEREKIAEHGWTNWALSPFSITRDALMVSSTHAYPSCPTRRDGQYLSALYAKRTFIAINLLENEELMPTLTRELIALIRVLGPDRVFVSVYENASMDLTVMHLRLLCKALDALGTPYKVIAKGLMELQQKEHGHRISRLSSLRNTAMEPLQELSPLEFDNVLWLNDVFHCHTDVLELLLQKQKQDAVQACALDFGPRGLIYDRWVLRNMRGRPFYNYSDLVDFFSSDITKKPRPMVLPLAEDAHDKAALEKGDPFQVFSCWNGITALSASVFAPPVSLRFRTALNDANSTDGVTDKESECYLSSVDLWKAEMGRVMVVPRVRVAYSLDVYEADRASKAYGAPPLTTPQIKWQTTPPETVYMNNFAAWYIPETPEPWDEA